MLQQNSKLAPKSRKTALETTARTPKYCVCLPEMEKSEGRRGVMTRHPSQRKCYKVGLLVEEAGSMKVDSCPTLQSSCPVPLFGSERLRSGRWFGGHRSSWNQELGRHRQRDRYGRTNMRGKGPPPEQVHVSVSMRNLGRSRHGGKTHGCGDSVAVGSVGDSDALSALAAVLAGREGSDVGGVTVHVAACTSVTALVEVGDRSRLSTGRLGLSLLSLLGGGRWGPLLLLLGGPLGA